MLRFVEIEPQVLQIEQSSIVSIHNTSHRALYLVGVELTSDDLDVWSHLLIQPTDLEERYDVNVGGNTFNAGAGIACVEYEEDMKAIIYYILGIAPQSAHRIELSHTSDSAEKATINITAVSVKDKRQDLIKFTKEGKPALGIRPHRDLRLSAIRLLKR